MEAVQEMESSVYYTIVTLEVLLDIRGLLADPPVGTSQTETPPL